MWGRKRGTQAIMTLARNWEMGNRLNHEGNVGDAQKGKTRYKGNLPDRRERVHTLRGSQGRTFDFAVSWMSLAITSTARAKERERRVSRNRLEGSLWLSTSAWEISRPGVPIKRPGPTVVFSEPGEGGGSGGAEGTFVMGQQGISTPSPGAWADRKVPPESGHRVPKRGRDSGESPSVFGPKLFWPSNLRPYAKRPESVV